MRASKWIAGCAAACGALVWACSRDEAGTARSPEATRATAAAEREPSPGPGAARLRYANGRVTLEANAAPVRPLLERLAAEARFELQIGPVDWPPLSASFEDLALAEALSRLIGNRDYTAQWRASASGDAPQLALLLIGPEGVADSEAADPRERMFPNGPPRAQREKSAAGAVAGALARAMRERSQQGESQEALLAKLHDPSPQVRMEAAADVWPEGEGVRALGDLLGNDPDPGVRAAASDALEMSDDPAAVTALLAGLGDPDPAVVVEVLDSLEFAGDETVIPHLAPLLEHPDARVREAAQDAIDSHSP